LLIVKKSWRTIGLADLILAKRLGGGASVNCSLPNEIGHRCKDIAVTMAAMKVQKIPWRVTSLSSTRVKKAYIRLLICRDPEGRGLSERR